MRGLTSTFLVLLVLAGLGSYIYFVEWERPTGGAEEKEKVFAVDAEQIAEITVTAEGETTTLRKVDGAWTITAPIAADADDTAASSLASGIAGLEVTRVVGDNVTNLAEYGLAEPRLKIAFTSQSGAGGEIHLGEKTATQSDLYAVRPGTSRVFLVQAWQETALAKKTFDLRDKRVLHFDRDQVDRVQLSQPGQPAIVLTRSGSDWMVAEPVKVRGDYSAIEGLLTTLSSGSMTALADTSGPQTFGLDQPRAVITVNTGSARASLEFGEETDGLVYARDPARQLIFTVDQSLAADVRRPVEAYRDKDVFEFRPFNASRVRIVRGSETYEFQKVAGTGDDAEKWQRVAGDQTTDIDATRIDDLLTKLSSLRAQSFNPTTNAAGNAPAALVVAVSYDDDKFERVRLIDSDESGFAVREDEPGVAVLDSVAYEDAKKALDALVTP